MMQPYPNDTNGEPLVPPAAVIIVVPPVERVIYADDCDREVTAVYEEKRDGYVIGLARK